MYITDKETEDVINIGIYTYKTVNNVIKYEYKNFDTWDITVDDANTLSDTKKSYYLIIDAIFNDAFAHWVAESAIYLLLFIELKKIYPTIKLHLQSRRNFKQLICNHFGIHNDDIVLTIEPTNICMFPLPISSLNKKTICDTYIKHLDFFIQYIHSTINNEDKQINILLMPRQIKENFIGNDRAYDISDISNKLLDNDKNIILNTDTIHTFQEQIDIVSKSKNIILHGGSGYFVNGLISKNATLIVLDATHHINQVCEYPKMAHLDHLIRSNNIIHDIPICSAFIYDNIKGFINI
jgi:hypothetical protein